MTNFLKRIIKKFTRSEGDASLRETLEELIEESGEEESSIASDERQLLGNVLDLRDLTAHDVMTPRADIVAIPTNISQEDLMDLFIKTGVSRLPVYQDVLDQVIGTIDIKDLLGALARQQSSFQINSIRRDVLFISPTMRTLDLLLQMRETGRKMAIVVDEFGGVDGIVTFASLIEEIIGDIQDAHSKTPKSQITVRPDGLITADGRTTFEELDDVVGSEMNLKLANEDVETLGGLVVAIAGRLPVRGELIKHPRGPEFEVLDADTRRIKRLAVRHWQ